MTKNDHNPTVSTTVSAPCPTRSDGQCDDDRVRNPLKGVPTGHGHGAPDTVTPQHTTNNPENGDLLEALERSIAASRATRKVMR